MSGIQGLVCPQCGSPLKRTLRFNEYECASCGAISKLDSESYPSGPGTRADAWIGAKAWVNAGKAAWEAIEEDPGDGRAWYCLIRALTHDFDDFYIGSHMENEGLRLTANSLYMQEAIAMGVFSHNNTELWGDNPLSMIVMRANNMGAFDDAERKTIVEFFRDVVNCYADKDIMRNGEPMEGWMVWWDCTKCFYILTHDDEQMEKWGISEDINIDRWEDFGADYRYLDVFPVDYW